MAASYLPDQDFLLPPTMREWLPEGQDQENFTDSDSRIRKRAGGGRGGPHHRGGGAGQQRQRRSELPRVLQAVQDNLGQLPAQALADTGYRSEAVFEQLADGPTELVVALGREGKTCAACVVCGPPEADQKPNGILASASPGLHKVLSHLQAKDPRSRDATMDAGSSPA